MVLRVATGYGAAGVERTRIDVDAAQSRNSRRENNGINRLVAEVVGYVFHKVFLDLFVNKLFKERVNYDGLPKYDQGLRHRVAALGILLFSVIASPSYVGICVGSGLAIAYLNITLE